MSVLFAKFAGRMVCLIAALAFAENLHNEWQQGRTGGAVLAAVMVAAFLPDLIFGDPIVGHIKSPWSAAIAKAVIAGFIYALFQGLLSEWQHERFGSAAIVGTITAFCILGFYYGHSSYGIGRQAPWDVWLERRRLARIDRWFEQEERNRQSDNAGKK